MPLPLQPSGSCPLPPDPLIFFKKKKRRKGGSLRLRGGAVGVLAGWFCGLRFCFIACLGILPKVACHGDDGRWLLAQVALDFPHCVKAQLDRSTPEDRIGYTRFFCIAMAIKGEVHVKSMIWAPKISLNDGRYVIRPFECKIIGQAEGLARVKASIHTKHGG